MQFHSEEKIGPTKNSQDIERNTTTQKKTHSAIQDDQSSVIKKPKTLPSRIDEIVLHIFIDSSDNVVKYSFERQR